MAAVAEGGRGSPGGMAWYAEVSVEGPLGLGVQSLGSGTRRDKSLTRADHAERLCQHKRARKGNCVVAETGSWGCGNGDARARHASFESHSLFYYSPTACPYVVLILCSI